MTRLVVQMHGEPGSGKSTVARAIAPRIGAVVLDKDVIKAALLRAGIEEARAARAAYEAFFAQAAAIVGLGHNVILDNPVFWPTVEQRWLALCEHTGSPAVLIECICPDQDELRRRLVTRTALESQPRAPLDLTRHPGVAPTIFEPRLVLDTTRPLVDLAEAAVAYIDSLTPRPPLPQGARVSS